MDEKKRQEQEENLPKTDEEVAGEQEVQEEDKLDTEREELRVLREQYERKLAELAAVEELRSRGLNVAFAPFVAAGEEASLEERVNAFEKLLHEEVRQEVMRRMRGQDAPREPARVRGYSREELKTLSAKEINAHWEEIARALTE